MKEITVSEELRNDVRSICGSIYLLNATSAIGYLFTTNDDETEIITGMFCHYKDEIDKDMWDYFYDFNIDKFYKL